MMASIKLCFKAFKLHMQNIMHISRNDRFIFKGSIQVYQKCNVLKRKCNFSCTFLETLKVSITNRKLPTKMLKIIKNSKSQIAMSR